MVMPQIAIPDITTGSRLAITTSPIRNARPAAIVPTPSHQNLRVA